jgi:peptide/nickel transport system permease protein
VGRYVLRRLLGMIPLLIGITMLTFAITNLVPGSPITFLEEQMVGNRQIRPEDIERIKHNLGLDKPVYIRYVVWFSNVVRGDLGISIRSYNPVHELILAKLPNTLLLTGTAFLFSFVLAIPVGVYSAVRRNSWFDRATNAGTVAGYSVPTFWLALLLILLVAVKFREWGLPALPAGGSYDLRGGGGFWDRVEHLVLPAFCLAFVQTAYWTRFIRSQMLEVLGQDFVRTARAKGLRERLVIFRHALRNALLPLVTLLGLALPDLFAGSVIIEQIFTYPGMGQLAFTAASQRDYPLIMGTVLFVSVLVILGNLLADVAYSLIDPRVRLT